ncbi:hypothetical protein BFT35_08990 [Thermoanaerobacterium thermosaccharolyticum]|uniref:hypothetical protein n=1 Tax=Thermoanaerobacterium thermosaccharolyticum TaxID=1517 RepID=UPI000C06DAB3|nr:hypothetical protein [Thermoanaerobacterium thermosaccharolyticum]PHO06810.1 hypothetical protein BFT35_08990 [Thermoanaerobacterium thermosaccharolyticum]
MRYVAFLDILGFKNIINNFNGHINELGNILNSKFRAAIYAGLTEKEVDINVIEKNVQSIELSPMIDFYQFSDSIIIYTDNDDIDRLEKIIRSLNILMARSILEGFPLRGALSKGDMFIKPPIIIGEPFISAYKLEEQQEWAGIIIDNRCFTNEFEIKLLELLEQEKLLVKTYVPIKDSKSRCIFRNYRNAKITFISGIAINWPQFAGSYVYNSNDFKDKFFKYKGKSNDTLVLRKYKNTYNFFINNIGSKELPPFVYSAIMLSKATIKNQK